MDANRPKNGGGDGAHGIAAEPDYVSARTVVGFAVILTLVTAVAMGLMAALFHSFQTRAQQRDAASIERAGLETRRGASPPAPRLQVYPVRHGQAFREAEAVRLNGYGWMARSTGAVHIPIERAMDLIVERGVGPLPAAPMTMPAPATPIEVKR